MEGVAPNRLEANHAGRDRQRTLAGIFERVVDRNILMRGVA